MADNEISFEDFVGDNSEVESSIKARRLNTRDANLARTVAGDPARQAADESDDQALSNVNQLEQQIARTKDPKAKATLVAEHNRIKGQIGKRLAAEDAQAPFPLSMIPSAEAAPEGNELSFEQFAGKKETPESNLLDTTLKGMKAVGGEAASLADLILGTPGFLLSVGGQLGGTIQAKARGVPFQADPRMLNPVTAYSVGREAGGDISAPFANPVKRVLDMFQSGEAYEEAKTTKGMEKFSSLLEDAGKWIEQKTGGKISRDAMPMFAETLMAGAAGIGSGKAKSPIPKENMDLMRQHIDRMRKAADEEAQAGALSPEEFVARVPVQQQINDMLGIKTPAQRAQDVRKRRQDVKTAFRIPDEGGDYGSIEESQFKAEERLQNESNLNQANVLDVLQKQPDARTAADLALLKLGQEAAQAERAKGKAAKAADEFSGEKVSMEEAMEIAQKPQEERSNVENTKLRRWSSQKGAVRPEALGLLAAAGIGATAGLLSDEDLKGAVLGGVAGLGAGALMTGGARMPARMREAGAVKGPGGMWHPEAIIRLEEPLNRALVRDIEASVTDTNNVPQVDAALKKMKPFDEWSNKAIKNYLNKYAGTERDPLKDVEIPNYGQGGDTVRWEAAWDKSVDKGTVRQHTDLPDFDTLSDKNLLDTPVFSLKFDTTREAGSLDAVRKYMVHVGDYLRQNVAADKLPQYDLTRAVRETAENDKRVAKQMEKAQGDSTKSLPVYKAYPDGFKWVELKLPEKLTEEQSKQVRKASIGGEHHPSGKYDYYEAIDASGKPLKNSYTDEIASGKTPEEAWLAGRLAEEGNSMGHCVGGYCEGVASGDSKIFSLRDSKGKSHVTIETSPTERLVDPQVLAEHIIEKAPELHSKVAKILREASPGKDLDALNRLKADPDVAAVLERDFPENIDQIKGKQNRAPNKEYLPYVQDFVKEGKWGEVGDLHNTGLKSVRDWLNENHRELGEDRFMQLRTKAKEKLGGEKALLNSDDWYKFRNEEADTKLTGPRSGQEGKVSQEMVAGLSVLGLGGIVGSLLADDPGTGALLGALAGGVLALPGARARLKLAANAVDYGLGSLSTRIGNISESVKLRGRDYERRILTESHAWLTKVTPFMQELQKVKGEKGEQLTRAILTNDKQAIADLMKGNVPLVAAWRQVQNVLHDLGEQLQGHGRFKTMLEDYFPRLVKDVDGLKAVLGVADRTRLEEALLDGERASMKNRGTPLTQVEQSSIINREVQGFRRAKGYQPGFAKQRGVDKITEALQPFYHTPAESLYAYVRGAVQDLEMAKFFGKDLAQTKIGGQNHINVDTSIGNLVGTELQAKKITGKQANELIGLLQSRFQGGERASSKLVQEVRNLGNLGLLGNIVSAATQLGDVATAIYAQGMRPAITAVVKQFMGDTKISAKDFGLADHIAEEFVSPTRTAAWLQSAFKWSGFTGIDRFGKTTNLNAALIKMEGMSRTNEGISKLSVKYGQAFGSEFPRLVADLKAGKMTERVRSLLFSELSDVQPISKLEMPQGYLDHPNGRLMYMLKTFMLKQADMMRRDVYNEAKKGNVGVALRNATGYALVLGLAGATTDAIRDWLLGRNPHFEAGDVLENVLKTFGWSEYSRAKFGKHPIQAVANMMVPPYQMMEQIITLDPKAIQYIPLIGKLYYAWEFGGKEDAEINRAKQTGELLSPEAKQRQRDKRQAARLKKLQ